MDKKRIIRWFLVILWMGIIFMFSCDAAYESSAKSGYIKGIIEDMVTFIRADSGGVTEYAVRKIGHLTEYAILGILFLRAFSEEAKNRKSSIHFGVTIIFVMLYAISDEIHQLFVPGRSGQVTDVFIDTAGGIIGIFLLTLFKKVKNTLFKPNKA